MQRAFKKRCAIHGPALGGRGSESSTWEADRMEHCSGGLVSLARYSEVRTKSFQRSRLIAGSGAAAAIIDKNNRALRIQEVIATSTCLGRYASRRLCGDEPGYNLRDAGLSCF
jgi:hypothetical protein